MSNPQQFQFAGGSLVADQLDGEVVIVNLDSGVYYSLTGVGAPLWQALQEGVESSQLARQVATAFPESNLEQLTRVINRLLWQLVEEGILSQVSGDALCAVAPAAEDAAIPGGELLKYSDMQELLMLDPIHEVDNTGWPIKPQL
ncbi:PqqD family protein [Candidatus Magnetaquicoccus inordinatus]|uniref:PqqD family protein n=1 Tax=Candidatus Magnetaquicoccus inordinatus TaxID=2496818 RepID=UPI00102CE261|nr:PqqD family protein [Candidatus Magnetaquicoccus inordinatus]